MPSPPLDIYMIAIGGTGMAPLACLLKEAGHTVRGSDTPLYPPMSTLLADAGITPLVGFDPDHLEPRPDLVIVGNAVPRSNPEAETVERLAIPRISMPQALARFFLESRNPLVVAGTHGKTTTSSLAAWVYADCGEDPGYLIGGVPRNFKTSFHQGTGPRFIIEGDEYNAAYFDRGPKFFHYLAETLIVTSVEYDHVDLYETPTALIEAYQKLIASVPTTGLVVACGDSPAVRNLVMTAPCPVVLYGLQPENDLRPDGPVSYDSDGTRFRIRETDGKITDLTLPLAGRHNLSNALAVWAAARRDGIPADRIARSLARFAGVKRRLEEIGTAGGVTVIDDFAHHPTAAGETLDAVRDRYPGRRLLVAYEPRSLTAGRSFLFDTYLDAFRRADGSFFAPVFHAARLTPGERLDFEALARGLRTEGLISEACNDMDSLAETLREAIRRGDVVVTMSSGDFGGLPHHLFAETARKSAAG